MRILRAFRIPESLDHKLESDMKKHHISRTDAVLRIMQSGENKYEKLLGEHEKLRQKFVSLDLTVSPSEKEIVQKALGLKYPDDCYDMLSIDGDPTKRECICPPSQRPVHVPSLKSRYIVDNPKTCWRCRACGYRKVKNTSNKKTQQKPRPEKVFCKRDSKWIDYGDNDCRACTWRVSECAVKRRILKKA